MVWIHDAVVRHRLRLLKLKISSRCPYWHWFSSWRHMMLVYVIDLVILILASHGPSLSMSMNRSHFAGICLWTLVVLLFLGILTYCNSLFSHPGSVYPVCHALFSEYNPMLLHPSGDGRSGKSKKPRVISTGHKKREDRASTVPPAVLSGSVFISMSSARFSWNKSNRHHSL